VNFLKAQRQDQLMILTVLLVNVLHGGAEELHTKVTRGLFTISVWHAVLFGQSD